jgi:hypothetical protein
MATQIKTKVGLKKAYKNCSKEVREYFRYFPRLLNSYPMDVCLAYIFSRLELGQNMALYCGIVRLHRANSEISKNVISTHHMTRESFVELYETVFGFVLPKTAHKDLKEAEKTRDAIMHGKNATDDTIRNAIARVLEYAEEINTQLDEEYGLKPFGRLQGFSGNAKRLDKRTTRFVLKGMGFNIS